MSEAHTLTLGRLTKGLASENKRWGEEVERLRMRLETADVGSGGRSAVGCIFLIFWRCRLARGSCVSD